MLIEKVKVCQPIQKLTEELEKIGFEIIEKKVSDYHFHEVYIKMIGEGDMQNFDFDIEKITRNDCHNFSCACHWSIVEIQKESPCSSESLK